MSVVDDYFAGLDEPARLVFEQIRSVAMDTLPADQVEDSTSYGMAALKYRHKPVLAFLRAKKHLSVFPCSGDAVEAVRDQLAGFDLDKGTIRFSVDQPLPDEAVRTIVRFRMAQIDAGHR